MSVPAFLQFHIDARATVTLADIPYTVESALHFSNGGGVYRARDTRTGEVVVLKEARPYAGLAADGADAVTRLHRERRALEQLSGLSCTPEVLDSFAVGEHHFLVLEYLDGKPLNTFFARRHPLIEADPDERRLTEYTEWALDVHAQVERAVEEVHARGVVFNDLHLFNIMIRDDGRVALLDFEAAHRVDEPGRQTVAHPGFVAPAGRRGTAVDRYALACLRLALFLPLTSLLALDRRKAEHLADVVARQFPVGRAFLDAALDEIADSSDRRPAARPTTEHFVPVAPGDWPRSRDSMTAAVRASATPSREERLFPGDVAQFATAGGGLSFGYGAAGVLYALAESGAERDESESSGCSTGPRNSRRGRRSASTTGSRESPGPWSTSATGPGRWISRGCSLITPRRSRHRPPQRNGRSGPGPGLPCRRHRRSPPCATRPCGVPN